MATAKSKIANNGEKCQLKADNAQNTAFTGPIKFDGKHLRMKVGVRKIVEYQSSVLNWLQREIHERDYRDRWAFQPEPLHNILMLPPSAFDNKPANSICTRLVRTATNRNKFPITCVRWTPEAKRMITGSSSGEFTLWDGKAFSFETIQVAHNSAVRAMEWSHSAQWMISADHQGFVKYWQSTMNSVKMYQIHTDAVRCLTFSPTDCKFASGSDDNTVRMWDFETFKEELVFKGHLSEVRCIDWNPRLKIIASGSKDSNLPVKLWDASSGECIETIYAHKSPVMDLQWNQDENLLLTASRDHVLMLFDLRNTKEPLQIFKGHEKEVMTVAWHPIHPSLFVSGGSDGSIKYWLKSHNKPIGSIDNAHDGIIWSLDWHPVGHVLVSGSNDHSTKFWTRNRLGDRMRDRYNLNILATNEEYDDGQDTETKQEDEPSNSSTSFTIPGLDLPPLSLNGQPLSSLKRLREDSEDDNHKAKCFRMG